MTYVPAIHDHLQFLNRRPVQKRQPSLQLQRLAPPEEVPGGGTWKDLGRRHSPTLAAWLMEQHPGVYRIKGEADEATPEPEPDEGAGA